MNNSDPIQAPHPDAGQAQAAQRARAEQQMVNTYHRVFHNPDGISVIADLVGYFRLNVPYYAQAPAGPIDPVRQGVYDGQRGVLLRIQQMLLVTPQGDANAAEAARPPVTR